MLFCIYLIEIVQLRAFRALCPTLDPPSSGYLNSSLENASGDAPTIDFLRYLPVMLISISIVNNPPRIQEFSPTFTSIESKIFLLLSLYSITDNYTSISTKFSCRIIVMGN